MFNFLYLCLKVLETALLRIVCFFLILHVWYFKYVLNVNLFYYLSSSAAEKKASDAAEKENSKQNSPDSDSGLYIVIDEESTPDGKSDGLESNGDKKSQNNGDKKSDNDSEKKCVNDSNQSKDSNHSKDSQQNPLPIKSQNVAPNQAKPQSSRAKNLQSLRWATQSLVLINIYNA